MGLCATDLELLDGSMVYLRHGRAHLPLVPGHEWVARVEDPGAPEPGFAVGDIVVGECSIGCGDCPVCASGGYHQCPRRQETGVMNRDGALAQQLRFPARSAHAVPQGRRRRTPSSPNRQRSRCEPCCVPAPRSRVLSWVAAPSAGWPLRSSSTSWTPTSPPWNPTPVGWSGLRRWAWAPGVKEEFDVVLEDSGNRGGVIAALDRLSPAGAWW